MYLSLSLSLSHTHTHTHCQPFLVFPKRTQQLRFPPLTLSLSRTGLFPPRFRSLSSPTLPLAFLFLSPAFSRVIDLKVERLSGRRRRRRRRRWNDVSCSFSSFGSRGEIARRRKKRKRQFPDFLQLGIFFQFFFPSEFCANH